MTGAPTTCQTPGAMYQISVSSFSVEAHVQFPGALPLDERDAEALELQLHHAIEGVLAEHWAKLDCPES